jgi:hypothetical protein
MLNVQEVIKHSLTQVMVVIGYPSLKMVMNTLKSILIIMKKYYHINAVSNRHHRNQIHIKVEAEFNTYIITEGLLYK